MTAKRLPRGGTIGIFCPAHVANPERYKPQLDGIKRMRFQVKLSENFYKDTWGYAASAKERADDLNALIADNNIDAILFNGGNSAAEILPYIDYENIRKNPKRIGSYSDGTSILNAIHAQTGLEVYYGTAPSIFDDMRHYNYTEFCAHFVEGYTATHFEHNSDRTTINSGTCEGVLVGGYTTLFALMLANKYLTFKENDYILLLESHERYGSLSMTAEELAFIEQTDFMSKVKGIVFGHFSMETPTDLLNCLERLGKCHNIPVIYTDDFGHGTRHGILPIGARAKLDADKQEILF